MGYVPNQLLPILFAHTRFLSVQIASKEMVLRKQPPGKLLPAAHAVGREYRVMHALASTPVAVPPMLAHCTDKSVIGTEFYLMDFVDGNLYLDPSLPKVTSGGREMVYRAMSSAPYPLPLQRQHPSSDALNPFQIRICTMIDVILLPGMHRCQGAWRV